MRWRRAVRGVGVGILTLLVVLGVDAFSGLLYKSDTHASAIATLATDARPQHTLLVFPGFGADCAATTQALTPHLATSTSLIVLCYAERGVDDGDVYQVVSTQLRRVPTAPLTVLGGSFGGMVAARFLTNLGADQSASDLRREPISLYLDTSPASAADVHAPPAAFWLSSWYRGGLISSLVWAGISATSPRPQPEPDASVSAIQAGDRYNAWVGVPALASQADYIGRFQLDTVRGVDALVIKSVYLESNDPGLDPLINVASARAAWRRVLPGLEVISVPTRRGDWHIPWTYRPEELLMAIGLPK